MLACGSQPGSVDLEVRGHMPWQRLDDDSVSRHDADMGVGPSTVLMLHGFPDSADVFRNQAPIPSPHPPPPPPPPLPTRAPCALGPLSDGLSLSVTVPYFTQGHLSRSNRMHWTGSCSEVSFVMLRAPERQQGMHHLQPHVGSPALDGPSMLLTSCAGWMWIIFRHCARSVCGRPGPGCLNQQSTGL